MDDKPRLTMSYWTQEQIAAFKVRLDERSRDLRADIARELAKYEGDRYGTLAATVADNAELAAADLVIDLDLAEIHRDIEELREVEAALKRIEAGTFGNCTECGAPIAPERLERSPHVARCIGCQQRVERTPGQRSAKL